MVSRARWLVSATKVSVQPASTAAVPATSNSCPGRTMPAPRALAAVSPQPAAMGVPAASPKARAAASFTSPMTRHGSTMRGSRPTSTPSVSQMAALHVPARLSHRPEKWMKV